MFIVLGVFLKNSLNDRGVYRFGRFFWSKQLKQTQPMNKYEKERPLLFPEDSGGFLQSSYASSVALSF